MGIVGQYAIGCCSLIQALDDVLHSNMYVAVPSQGDQIVFLHILLTLSAK